MLTKRLLTGYDIYNIQSEHVVYRTYSLQPINSFLPILKVMCGMNPKNTANFTRGILDKGENILCMRKWKFCISRQFWSHVLIIKHVGRKRCVWCVQLQIVTNIFRPNILLVKNWCLISFALCEKLCSHYEHRLSSCCSAICASFI
jgi:hypothetical protein